MKKYYFALIFAVSLILSCGGALKNKLAGKWVSEYSQQDGSFCVDTTVFGKDGRYYSVVNATTEDKKKTVRVITDGTYYIQDGADNSFYVDAKSTYKGVLTEVVNREYKIINVDDNSLAFEYEVGFSKFISNYKKISDE